MTYEAEVDLRNANTSHSLLVELVGRDKRVLDVGCAGGYLGRMLARRGCRVSGVEQDPEAAEAAEKVLDTVLVGDVATLDLVGHFGKESFDVIVFGDVLEHVADPAAVLRRVAPLLARSGAVVASVPNVAHGAVRLALLSGRFDYRPLGLLDDTHLRFFTRESLYELFRETGFVPVDVRRTTAGVFETELNVRREDFDRSVVDAVEGDPESTTYQFVLRAVPTEEAEAGHTAGRPAPAVAARVRVGLWAALAPDDGVGNLVARITVAELERWMPGAFVRVFSSSPQAGPGPHDAGLPIEPLGPWSAERAGVLADQLDGAVVAGDLPATTGQGGEGSGRFLAEGLAAGNEADCPVLWSAVGVDGQSPAALAGVLGDHAYATAADGWAGPSNPSVPAIPDPLLLAPRHLRPRALARRLEYLRMMGWFPVDGPVLAVEAHVRLLAHVPAVAAALDQAITAGGASVVFVQVRADDEAAVQAAGAVAGAMTCPAYRLQGGSSVDDLVAVVAGATEVAASSPAVIALAAAYERPLAVLLLSTPDHQPVPTAPDGVEVVRQPYQLEGLFAAGRLRSAAGVPDRQTRLDAHFHHMAAVINTAAAGRPRPASLPSLSLPEYVAAMEAAYHHMRDRLRAERRAVADHLGSFRGAHEGELRHAREDLERLRAERDALEAQLDQAAGDTTRRDATEEELRARVDAAKAELEALKNIRILRLLRPARAVYARLRGSRL